MQGSPKKRKVDEVVDKMPIYAAFGLVRMSGKYNMIPLPKGMGGNQKQVRIGVMVILGVWKRADLVKKLVGKGAPG